MMLMLDAVFNNRKSNWIVPQFIKYSLKKLKTCFCMYSVTRRNKFSRNSRGLRVTIMEFHLPPVTTLHLSTFWLYKFSSMNKSLIKSSTERIVLRRSLFKVRYLQTYFMLIESSLKGIPGRPSELSNKIIKERQRSNVFTSRSVAI